MRLFIYELISAGGLGADFPASLRNEGAAMLAALVADFARVPNVEVFTLLAHDFQRSLGHRSRRVAGERLPRRVHRAKQCGWADVSSRRDAGPVTDAGGTALLAGRSW